MKKLEIFAEKWYIYIVVKVGPEYRFYYYIYCRAA